MYYNTSPSNNGQGFRGKGMLFELELLMEILKCKFQSQPQTEDCMCDSLPTEGLTSVCKKF